MKVSEIDWGILRGALILLVVSLLVCGGLVYATTHYGEIAERDIINERRKLTAVRSEYQAIDDEQKIMQTFLPQYEALFERGVIGAERRLSWVETLRAAARDGRFPALRYELFPREEYVPEFPLPEGVFKVYASGMRIDVGLLHEGDLAFLLRRLQKDSTGLFTLSKCTMKRKFDTVRFEPKLSNIDASCELKWFTVNKPEEEV